MLKCMRDAMSAAAAAAAAEEPWLQTCPAATQPQRLAILDTTDPPLDILTTRDPVQARDHSLATRDVALSSSSST